MDSNPVPGHLPGRCIRPSCIEVLGSVGCNPIIWYIFNGTDNPRNWGFMCQACLLVTICGYLWDDLPIHIPLCFIEFYSPVYCLNIPNCWLSVSPWYPQYIPLYDSVDLKKYVHNLPIQTHISYYYPSIWRWVKTLYSSCSHQNSWDWWMSP